MSGFVLGPGEGQAHDFHGAGEDEMFYLLDGELTGFCDDDFAMVITIGYTGLRWARR
jgi:hypothetical protein